MFIHGKFVWGAVALLAMAVGCSLGEKDIGSLTESGTGAASSGIGSTTTETGGASSGSASEAVSGSSAETSVTATTTGSESSATQDTSSTGGEYERACELDDFICEGFGCEEQESVVLGECYKTCTPGSTAAIGEMDDECDEPQRPFCGQVGDPLGGDFDCNGCHHICVAAQDINVCMAPADNCGE